MFLFIIYVCILFTQSGGVYAVSEDEMIQYHHVFADSGNVGAQVLFTYS